MSSSTSRIKNKTIQVRATEEEKARLKARAEVFGISVGELCRQTIFGATPKSRADQVAIQALAMARSDLGKLGGLLKGWMGGAFPSSPAAERNEVRALLNKIEAAQRVVVTMAQKLA